MMYIYILVDPLSSEIKYCGKTNNVKIRFFGHLKEKKYNKDKIEWIKNLKKQKLKPELQIIDEVSDNDSDFWEKYWISQLRCWGFNLLNKTEGGEYSTIGFKHTKETRDKISQIQKGRKLPTEWKNNISIGKKGVKFSDKHKKNLSISHKGNIPQITKPVYQIDINTGEIIKKYDSISDALRNIKVSLKSSLISQVCNGKLKSAYNYYWCYVDKYSKFKYKEYNRIENFILQYDKYGNLIKKYSNIAEAARDNNLNSSSISHALTDTPSYSGYIWIYEKDDVNKILNLKMNKIKKDYILHQIDIKTGEIVNKFNSIKEAESKTNIKHISSVINGKRNNAGGFNWIKILV